MGGRGVEVHPTHSVLSELTNHGKKPCGLVSGTEGGASDGEVEPYYDSGAHNTVKRKHILVTALCSHVVSIQVL